MIKKKVWFGAGAALFALLLVFFVWPNNQKTVEETTSVISQAEEITTAEETEIPLAEEPDTEENIAAQTNEETELEIIADSVVPAAEAKGQPAAASNPKNSAVSQNTAPAPQQNIVEPQVPLVAPVVDTTPPAEDVISAPGNDVIPTGSSSGGGSSKKSSGGKSSSNTGSNTNTGGSNENTNPGESTNPGENTTPGGSEGNNGNTDIPENTGEKGPEIQLKWDDITCVVVMEIKDLDYLFYYSENLDAIYVNGVERKAECGPYSLTQVQVPYKFLNIGENTIVLTAKGYQNVTLHFTTPNDFVMPKIAPAITAVEMVEGYGVPLVIDAVGENSQDWLNDLKEEHITYQYNIMFPNEVPFQMRGWTLEKDLENNRLILAIPETTALYNYSLYQVIVSVPGYNPVWVNFSPRVQAPELSTKWLTQGNNSLEIVEAESSVSVYLSKECIFELNDRKLIENEDFVLKPSWGGIEILAKNFTPGETYTLRITDKTKYYSTQLLTITCPDEIIVPDEAPQITVENTLQGKDVSILFDAGYDNWKENITKIVLTYPRQHTKQVNYQIQGDTIVISGDYFEDPGKNRLTIQTQGYDDVTATFVILKEAQAVQREDDWYKELVLSFRSDGSTDFSFADNVTATLNGESFSNINSSGFGLAIPFQYFTEETNILVLSNPEYVDIVLEIPRLAEPEATGKSMAVTEEPDSFVFDEEDTSETVVIEEEGTEETPVLEESDGTEEETSSQESTEEESPSIEESSESEDLSKEG